MKSKHGFEKKVENPLYTRIHDVTKLPHNVGKNVKCAAVFLRKKTSGQVAFV
jgi:hypothetical protein